MTMSAREIAHLADIDLECAQAGASQVRFKMGFEMRMVEDG